LIVVTKARADPFAYLFQEWSMNVEVDAPRIQ
jgi:hypothetical protein